MYRLRPARESFIPKDARPVDCTGTDAAVYVYETAGRCYGLGFHGKAQRPDFHYSFRSEQSRTDYIDRYLEGRKAPAAAKAQRQAERKAKGRGVAVGDVLRASWGYEQTNIDYYEVTALVGKTMVEIRQIGCTSIDTAWLQGRSAPLKGNYVGAPMRKVAVDGQVKVRDWGVWARKMEPIKVAGCEVYEASHWTAYH